MFMIPIENDNTVQLSLEQIKMLQMSNIDIKNGKLITQSQLDLDDLKWLKELMFSQNN